MGSLPSTITDRSNAQVGAAFVAGYPKLVYVWSVNAYDKTGETTSWLRWSDVGFTTGASDTPAHTHFPARLVVPSVTASLVGSDTSGSERPGLPGLRNFAPPEVSTIKILNTDTDPDSGAGPLDDYADRDLWSFAGRECKLEVGAEDQAYPSGFYTVLGLEGTVAGEPVWDAEGNLIFTMDPPLERFGQPYQRRLYGGWGAALVFDGSTTYIDYGNEWNPGATDCCFEWRLSWPDKANTRRIQQKRATLGGGTDAGFSFWITTSKQLRFGASDGTNSGTINMGSASAYDDEVKRMFSVNFDAGNQIQAFVTEVSGDTWTTTSLGTIDTSSWGPIFNSLDNICGAAASGASPSFDGELDEFRVWRKIKSSAEINDDARESMTGSEPFLAACFKCDDRAGSTAWQEVTVPGLQSLEYSSGTHKISFGNVLNADASQDFSFGWWFKTEGVSGVDLVFGNRSADAATNAGYHLCLSDSSGDVSGIFRIDDGTTRKSATSTSDDYGDGVWHFLGGRCDRTADTIECIMLRSRWAQLEISATTDITGIGSLSNANSLVVGRSAGGSAPFAGRTGHGFFLTEAVTDAQFLNLARYLWDLDTITVPGNVISAESTASSFWNQDEGSMTSVADSWGSRTGTVTGASWKTQDATINGTVAYATTYEGDGTIDGLSDESSIQGIPKPEVWGRVQGFPLILVDQNDDGASVVDPIYQWADPDEGASKAVEQVYSGGLILAEGVFNDYTVDLTNNAVTLTAPQDEQLTANLKGYVDGSSDLIETTADIATQLFTNIGESSLNAASFTQLNTDYGFQVGLGLVAEERNTEEIFDALFRPSVWGTKNYSGEIVVGVFDNLDGVTADFALTTKNIVRNGVVPLLTFPPASRVDIGFRRIWHPLTSFLGGVQAPEQIRQSKDYSWTGANVRDIENQHLDARPVRVTSLIHRKRDAKIEAQRLAGILNRPLMILQVQLARDLFKAEIGDVASLTYPRFGFSSGKNFMVIGYSYPKSPSLLLWGPFDLA